MKKLSNTQSKSKNRKALPPLIKKSLLKNSRAGKSNSPLETRGGKVLLRKAAMPTKAGRLTHPLKGQLKAAMVGIARAGVIKTATQTLRASSGKVLASRLKGNFHRELLGRPGETVGKESGKNAATELMNKIQASEKRQPPQKNPMKSSAASKKAGPAKAIGRTSAAAAPRQGAGATEKPGAAPLEKAKAKKPGGAASKILNNRARTAALLRNGAGGSDASLAEAVCREVACEGLATTGGYCRLHYIKNWKKIKRKEQILSEGKLNQYIEELVVKYPDKYIEAIRQDLSSEKEFAKVIYDLDLDESVDEFDIEGETVDSLIDTIKRDFDDEGETGF